jgi:uncharacterized protein YbaR (Trm112 family)
MRRALLELLECPFCGGALTLVSHPATVERAGRIEQGVLGCECCAYPIVDGLPILRADDLGRSVLSALDHRDVDEALRLSLELDDESFRRWRALFSSAVDPPLSDTLAVLAPPGEGAYFAYRFSDPTFLVSEGLVRALAPLVATAGARYIDLGGGIGHLARVLDEITHGSGGSTLLADYHPWKLWLARRHLVPRADAIVLDANAPLPLGPGATMMAVCSDAFHYVWSRRQLSSELRRIVSPDGIVVLTHMHNALVDNPSAGMPLSPVGYRRLAERVQGRLFADEELRRGVAAGTVELGVSSGESAAAAASFTLVAAPPAVYRRHDLPPMPRIGVLRLNPLYRVAVRGAQALLTLAFPSREYEDEFGSCREYLPERLELPAASIGDLEILAGARPELLARRVILDVPARYLGEGQGEGFSAGAP